MVAQQNLLKKKKFRVFLLDSETLTSSFKPQYVHQSLVVGSTKDKLQEWMEHWSTHFWKSETSRDNQKIISTSFEHLKKCVNFQN